MSGKVRVRNCVIPYNNNAEPARDMIQGCFTAIYRYLKYLETVGVTTEIARHGGVGGSASNVDFWDGAAPFLCNAWFVFRFNTNANRTWPWYYLVQWNKGNVANFGVAPGAPGLWDNGVGGYANTAIAVQAAIGIGGDQNPWNGTGVMGTSAKGTPVWKVPAGGTDVYVFPRSNSTGGAHTASRQNCTLLFHTTDYGNYYSSAINFVSDDDSFMIVYQSSTTANPNNLTDYTVSYSGLYTPVSGLTVTYPFVQWGAEQGYRPTNQSTGPTTGTSPGGGIYNPGVTPGVRQFGFSYFDDFWLPPTFRGDGKGLMVPPVMLVCTEASYTGALGYPQLYQVVYPPAGRHRIAGQTRKFVGYAHNSTGGRIFLPWSSAVPDQYHTRPAGLDSRDGTTFIYLDTPISETVGVSESLVVTP